MATTSTNARPVKYLTGTSEQYNALKNSGTINEWAYYYIIDTNAETQQKTYSLYLGETLLSTGDDNSAIAALSARISALEGGGGTPGGNTGVGGHSFYEIIVDEEDEDETDDDILLANVSNPSENDVAIVCRAVRNSTGTAIVDQYYRTAYYYQVKTDPQGVRTTSWAAMVGNYNAKNVYFEKNIPITMKVGYVSGSLPFAGKNLEQAFEQTFRQENTSSTKVTADPSCSVSHSNTATYLLVGSTYTPTSDLTLSLVKGSYTQGYGYVTSKNETVAEGTAATTIITNDGTGVELKSTTPFTLSWNGSSVSPKSGTTNVFEISSVTKTTAPATAGYVAKAYYQNPGNPVSNYGNIYPSKKLTRTETSNATGTLAYWYYPMYKGFTYNPTEGESLADKYAVVDTNNITAARIQQFDAVTDADAYNTTKTKSATASRDWRQYFYAFPQGYNWTMSSVKDSTNATCPLSKTTVTLTFNNIDVVYDVYYIHNASPYATKDISWTL